MEQVKTETVKRWIELPKSLSDVLDSWAESEKRSSKQQTELILEQAIQEHIDAERKPNRSRITVIKTADPES